MFRKNPIKKANKQSDRTPKIDLVLLVGFRKNLRRRLGLFIFDFIIGRTGQSIVSIPNRFSDLDKFSDKSSMLLSDTSKC